MRNRLQLIPILHTTPVKKSLKSDIIDTIKTPFLGPDGATVRKRSFRSVMLYAISYPFSTGIVIYAGLMTFSMVLTNITGFLPEIARDLYKGELNTAGSIFTWLFAFFLGGFFAGWCTEREKLLKWKFLHLLPLLTVVCCYLTVGFSGKKSDALNPVLFPAMVLFTVGVLNAMVSLTTSSLIKASQMTGMVVELGVDVAELFHSEGEKRRLIRREAWLRIVVMCSFIGGAMLSVAFFPQIGTKVFFVPAGIIASVMVYDVWKL
ncbi:MAG: DUF1275 domain-containing protein [Chitinophagales bacterium]|nr:DUF1275 domain-containing protein [Chitinophagales bacterium]